MISVEHDRPDRLRGRVAAGGTGPAARRQCGEGAGEGEHVINGASRRSLGAPSRHAGRFDVETLELLPCGCVAALRRADPWPVKVVSLEAKGPYCILEGHSLGAMLKVVAPEDWLSEEDEE